MSRKFHGSGIQLPKRLGVESSDRFNPVATSLQLASHDFGPCDLVRVVWALSRNYSRGRGVEIECSRSELIKPLETIIVFLWNKMKFLNQPQTIPTAFIISGKTRPQYQSNRRFWTKLPSSAPTGSAPTSRSGFFRWFWSWNGVDGGGRDGLHRLRLAWHTLRG